MAASAVLGQETTGKGQDDCFHCSNDPTKFLPLPKEQQPYCSKCFDALFVFDNLKQEENNNGDHIAKTKPPPVPPKPKGKSLGLFSTLPQPFHKVDMDRPVTPTISATPPTPPPPPPPSSSQAGHEMFNDHPLPPPPPPSSFPPQSTLQQALAQSKPFPPPPSPPELRKDERTAYSPIPPTVIDKSSPTPTAASSPRLSRNDRSASPSSGIRNLYGSNRVPINYKTMAAIPQSGQTFKSSTDEPSKTYGSSTKSTPGRSVVPAQESAPQRQEPSVHTQPIPKISIDRQISEPEETHLDQLNSIFKSASLGGRRAEPSIGGTSGSSSKPPVIATKPKFNCSKCSCNLLGKTVESQDSKMYCTPCYRLVISNKRCATCEGDYSPDNELITYKGEDYHIKCFRCVKCDLPIGKKTFCCQKDGIFCSDCYFQSSGRICVKCKKYLKSTGFLFRNEPWHHECFVCTRCKTSLGDREIFCKDELPYCNSCYDLQYVEKCAACSQILAGETVEYESKQYHDACFCCNKCEKPIGSTSFFPKEGSIFCESCYAAQFGKTCRRCKSLISPSSGFGLVFKEEHYHRECFVCSTCTKSLVNVPVHSSKAEGNSPYCGGCYDELFSKRCASCSNIISGVIGSKFMAFQEKYWHVECFNCKMCQTSLENRKFVPVQGEMHCIACSRYGPVSS